MSAGIDYGMGRTNRDPGNGIRYGVISQHSVMQAWADSAEPDYGKATCPKCGNEVFAFDSHDRAQQDFDQSWGCRDYSCVDCEITINSEHCYPDEAQGWSYNDEGYSLTDCLDSDIFILKSPYYTHAQFCSPCVPGAGNLDSHDPDGAQTYCLGHDWFEDGKAPYPVYDVATNTLVEVERNT